MWPFFRRLVPHPAYVFMSATLTRPKLTLLQELVGAPRSFTAITTPLRNKLHYHLQQLPPIPANAVYCEERYRHLLSAILKHPTLKHLIFVSAIFMTERLQKTLLKDSTNIKAYEFNAEQDANTQQKNLHEFNSSTSTLEKTVVLFATDAACVGVNFVDVRAVHLLHTARNCGRVLQYAGRANRPNDDKAGHFYFHYDIQHIFNHTETPRELLRLVTTKQCIRKLLTEGLLAPTLSDCTSMHLPLCDYCNVRFNL